MIRKSDKIGIKELIPSFELPADFLKKWLAVAGEKPMSAEQAGEEFDKSEKGLRYQLIEGKILKENNLQINFEELKDFTKGFVKAQMAQYGQLNPEEKELDGIVDRKTGGHGAARGVNIDTDVPLWIL